MSMYKKNSIIDKNNRLTLRKIRMPTTAKVGQYIEYSSQFSVINATAMAYLSHIVYPNAYSDERGKPASLRRLSAFYKAALDYAGFTIANDGNDFTMDSQFETDYVVFADKKAVYIIFTGTESLSYRYSADGIDPSNLLDIWTDINAKLATRSAITGKIHPGFHDAYHGVHSNIRRLVNQCRERHKKVFVTGHSLGGALTTIAAYRLHRAGVKITAVYPLASPRVGNDIFTHDYRTRLGNKTYRIKRDGDHITGVPTYGFSALGIGSYLHVDQFYLLTSRIKRQHTTDDTYNYGNVLDGIDLDFFRKHHSRDQYFHPLYVIAQEAIKNIRVTRRTEAREKAKIKARVKAKAKIRMKANALEKEANP